MTSELGDRIRTARKAKRITLRELARRVRKSPAFISMLENNDPAPAVKEETLEAVAQELSLNRDELLGLAGRVPKEATPESGLDVALYRRVRGLSDVEKKKLLKSFRDQK